MNFIYKFHVLSRYNFIFLLFISACSQMVRYGVDYRSTKHISGSLKKCDNGNTFLHQFVLDNTHPNGSSMEKEKQIEIESMLKKFSDNPKLINASNNDGYSPLHLAALNNDFVMMKLLCNHFKNNIDMNVKDKHGRTPFSIVMYSGKKIDFIEFLRDKKII